MFAVGFVIFFEFQGEVFYIIIK